MKRRNQTIIIQNSNQKQKKTTLLGIQKNVYTLSNEIAFSNLTLRCIICPGQFDEVGNADLFQNSTQSKYNFFGITEQAILRISPYLFVYFWITLAVTPPKEKIQLWRSNEW